MKTRKPSTRHHGRGLRATKRKVTRTRDAVRIETGLWSARRYLVGSTTGPAIIRLSFPTESGVTNTLSLENSELRHPKSLLDKLSNYLPVFPVGVGESDQDRMAFIKGLLEIDRGPIPILPTRTGFVDATQFATYGEIIHANGKRSSYTRFGSEGVPSIIDIRGTRKGAVRDVLKVALKSTYLSFGIGVALAAPLPTYLKFFRDEAADGAEHLTETAVFNLSGRSSSGKSSVCLAALSLCGSPDRAGSLDFSSRGLAEAASDSNDLLLVLDDTEKTEDGMLVKTLKKVVHTVPGGRSRMISRGVDQNRFPRLDWSTFALSSSPRSVIRLAAESHWAMTPGDKVRLFNISVPPATLGGIFDRLNGTPSERAKQSVSLTAQLERGYMNHHGHIIPGWVEYLLKKDRSAKVAELVQEFVQETVMADHGWERRFAKKFGYVYAALLLGIEANLLPWPKDFPLSVVKKCYRKARNAAKSDRERAEEAVTTFASLIYEPGRVVDDRKDNRPIEITKNCVGIRYWKDGRLKIGVLDKALERILKTRKAKVAFTNGLARVGLVAAGHGHAGTVQEHIALKRGEKIISRPRLWSIDLSAFEAFMRKQERR